jgi:hypothetical protein
MTEFILGLFLWVCVQTGVDPDSIKKPTVLALNPAQMATLYCGKPEYCDDLKPVYFDGKTLYLMQGIEWEDNRLMTSYLVHEMVHYVQTQKIKDKRKIKRYAEAFESQALTLQEIYLKSISI